MSETKTDNTPSKWGMVIDQDLCMGCQACVTACAMENNVSFIGEEDVSLGRSMQWIHIERFWNGQYPDVFTSFQPILCQQCGNAPCETTSLSFAAAFRQRARIFPRGMEDVCRIGIRGCHAVFRQAAI